MKISASIICKNEESCIERCLRSLYGIDEIVIVDTGSDDSTGDIVKKLVEEFRGTTDIKYYEGVYKWNDNFAEARNESLKRCTGDWIFTIDCDNWLVTPIADIRKEIDIAVEKGMRSIACTYVSEKDDFRHDLPLLYKRCPEIFWKGAIHNYMSDTDGYKGGDILVKYDYSPSHSKDPDRSFRILKKVVTENPDCVREKFYLAKEYFNRGDYPCALYWYNKYLPKSNFGAEEAEAHFIMAKCYWMLGEGDKARGECLSAIGLNTNFREALLFMAEMSGPINSKRWLYFAETADNQSVLFKRVGTHEEEQKKNKRIYIPEGMHFFGDKAKKQYGIEEYNPETDKDKPTIFFGLYFEKDIDILRAHTGPVTIYWHGSDILELRKYPEWVNVVTSKNARHLTQSVYKKDWLADFGIQAEHYPIFFGDMNKYQMCYKPSITPQLYMHANKMCEGYYGVDLVAEIAEEMPDIKFHIYGTEGFNIKHTDNVIFHGWVDEDVMDNEIKDYQGLLQFVSEGVSQTMAKAMKMGQYIIMSHQRDGFWIAPDKKSIIEKINLLRTTTEPNVNSWKMYEHFFKTL